VGEDEGFADGFAARRTPALQFIEMIRSIYMPGGGYRYATSLPRSCGR
jgi:hypothetical protein